jgi:hypothetical protein
MVKWTMYTIINSNTLYREDNNEKE